MANFMSVPLQAGEYAVISPVAYPTPRPPRRGWVQRGPTAPRPAARTGVLGGQAVPHPVLRGALWHVHVRPRRVGGRAVRSQGNWTLRLARDGPTGHTRQSPGLGRGQPGCESRTLVLLELPRERGIPARLPQRPDDAALQPSGGAAPHRIVRRLD